MSKPSYEELVERYEDLRHQNIELRAELVDARKARTSEVNRYAGRNDRLLREVARSIEDLKAWRARLNPWTAQGWQIETLEKLLRRLTSASEAS